MRFHIFQCITDLRGDVSGGLPRSDKVIVRITLDRLPNTDCPDGRRTAIRLLLPPSATRFPPRGLHHIKIMGYPCVWIGPFLFSSGCGYWV
ncbi:hypothetical protein SBA6_1300010 [Candidatus Sulfopaludibacter sp. SbA6]|nr:hypothetical protein SBA6_1300010 [Candidatus Sulfopaludibacter sp. SbA6]